MSADTDFSDMPTVTTELNRPAVPTDGARITAKIEVEPGRQQRSVQRQIVLCVDTSGSMNGEKIQRARDGASWVFGLLESNDYVGIVTFDSEAEVAMGPTKWGNTTREEAMAHVEELSAGGGTDVYDGLTTAGEMLKTLDEFPDSHDKAAVRRVLLLSDGKDDAHTSREFRELADQVDDAGIRIESAGIGEDYDESTIRALGTTARGTWAHLDTAGDIKSFFGDAVEAANSVVAADAQLELDVAPGVEIGEVYRALPQTQAVDLDWENNTAVVKLPDLTERERQEIVMKIRAPAHEAGSGVALGQVRLTARGGQATERITIDYTDDNAELARANEAVQMSHRETVIRTELGRGNLDAAETEVERMTRIHGEDAPEVEQVRRQTKLVEEGGRAERNRATKIVDDEGRE
jgi:Ca-activated chloride channel family protein